MTGLFSDDRVEDIGVLLEAGRSLLRAGAAAPALREFDAAYDIAIECLDETDGNAAALSALVRCAYWQAAAQTRNRDWGLADEKTYELLRLAIGAPSGLTGSDCCAIYYARGRCYLDFGGFDDALACFDTALSYDGAHSRALRDRVRACRGTGDQLAGYEHAVRAVQAVPGSFDLRVELVNASLDVHSIDKAEAEARALLSTFPDRRCQVLVLLAHVFAVRDELDQALDYCAQALQLDDQDAAAAELQAWLVRRAAPESPVIALDDLKPESEPEPEPELEPEGWLESAVDSTDAVVAASSGASGGVNRAERVAALLKAASDHWEIGDHTAALRDFESVTELDPSNREALYGQLDCLWFKHEFGEASDRIRRAIDAHPDDWALLVDLGRLLHAQEKFDDALLYYERARDMRPKDDRGTGPASIEICVARSGALCALDRCAEANRDVEELYKNNQDNFLLREERAWIAHDQKRFRNAEYHFDVLIMIAKEDAEVAKAEYGRGYVALTQGNYGEAKGHFHRAKSGTDDVPAYRLAYAFAVSGSGGKEERNKEVKICHEIADKSANPLAETCLGVLYFKLEEFNESRYHLKRALELKNGASGHADLGAFYLRRGDFELAEEELREAIRRDRDNVFAHCELGALLLQRERVDEAELEFRMAKSASGPPPVAAVIGLSACHLELGRPSEAERELQVALKQAMPRDLWRLHLAMARVLIRRGQNEGNNASLFHEAHTEACQAISLRETEAESHYRAGIAAVLYGSNPNNRDDGRSWYEKAMKHLLRYRALDGDRPDARRLIDDLNRALAAQRRSLRRPRVLAGLCGVFLVLMIYGVVSQTLKVDMVPLTLVFAFIAVFLVILTFAVRGADVELINISKLLELKFSPGKDEIPSGPVGKFPIGIDRLELPPSPFWRTPRRSLPVTWVSGKQDAAREPLEERVGG
jgi:tetratricopeptide (TPR) repeat protein